MNRKAALPFLVVLSLLLVSVACAPVGTPTAAPAATSPLSTPLPPAPHLAPWYVEGVMVETYAGTGEPGCKDGPAAEAQFNWPFGLVVDAAGNLYVFDWRNARIRSYFI